MGGCWPARPDLLAEAALVLQGVGDPTLSLDLRRLAEEALAARPDAPAATRARLHAQLAEAHLYLSGEEAADTCSRQSVAEAELAGDRDTLLIALRARRLATLSPEGSDEALQLADRVLELAPGPESARHAFWAHGWRIQVWLVQGRLDLIAGELERLAIRAGEVAEPLAAAQLLRFQAILASARGRFDDSLDLAERGQAAFLRSGQGSAAGQHAGFRCSLGRFVGYPPDLVDALAMPPDEAGPFVGLARARSVLVLAGSDMPARPLRNIAGWSQSRAGACRAICGSPGGRCGCGPPSRWARCPTRRRGRPDGRPEVEPRPGRLAVRRRDRRRADRYAGPAGRRR